MNKLSRRIIGNWAKLLPNKRQRRQQRRRLMAESLEDRRLLAVDMNFLHNDAFPRDVTGDNAVSPIDALAIINHINGASGLGEGEHRAHAAMMPDVNNDGFVSPSDVLNVINGLAEGEAGNVVTFSHQATDLEGTPITSASIGETFVLQTLVQDMRATPQGVFAGYFDLDYDESLVQVNMRESQTIQLSGTPTGGTYRLSFNGQTTAPITYASRHPTLPAPFNTDANIVADFNAGLIETALLGLSNIDLGDAEVVPFTGGTVDGGVKFNYEVKFGGQYANTDVSKMAATDVQLTGGTSPTVAIFNTSDELLVPTLAELQETNPSATAQDRANLVARSEQTRSFTFAFPKYSSGQSGVFGTVPNSNMIIDEIGAFTSNQTPGDGTQEVLVEIQVTALAGGTATFIGNTADQAPDHDVLVFGLDNAVSSADIGFMPLDLPISSDILAVDDGPLSFDEGSTNNSINVLANDSISSGTGPTITAPVGTTSITGGQLTLVDASSKNGTNYTFTPTSGFSGQTSFTYTISNGQGATASADVTINVQAAGPTLVISGPTSRTTNEDTEFTLSGFSITDPAVTPITVNLSVSGSGTLSQTTLTGDLSTVISGLNSVTYTPLTNSTASDTINISASAGTLSDTHTVNVTITPVNDPPQIVDLPTSLTAFLDQTLALPSFSVTDPDSTVTVTLSVDQGTLSGNGSSGQSINITGGPGSVSVSGVTYTPPSGSTDPATLTVQADDGTATPVSQTVPISVVPPLLPFAATDSITISEGATSGSVDVFSNDMAKSDKANLSITATSLPIPAAQGSVTQSGSTFTYTPPNADFFGTTSFTYTIADSGDAGDGPSTGTVAITVNPVNDSPIISKPNATPTFAEDSNAMSISGLSVTDVDNSSVDVTLSVSHGTLSAGGQSGSTIAVTNTSLSGLTYQPDLNYFGPDTLSVSADDGTAPSVNDTVSITITPVNDAPTIVVPGAQSFLTDFDNLFTSTPNPFQISDIDAGNNDVQVDLTISDGTLTISAQGSASVAQITDVIRLSGTVAEINAALSSGVSYRSSIPTAANTTRPLNATVSDLGNTGAGDILTASATVDVELLDFVPVNIHGQAFIDDDHDNLKDSEEPGIAGIRVTLSGTDFQGNAVTRTATTDALGGYSFLDLRPNAEGQTYSITQQQPAFIRGGSEAAVNVDARGNMTVASGSLAFGSEGFVPEYADFWDRLGINYNSPSGVLFGFPNMTQTWSMIDTSGDGWDTSVYSDFRLSLNGAGDAGVLTVYDKNLGQDRTANVSEQAGTLTSYGTASNRIYRVIGTSSLLGGAAVAAAAEGSADDSPVAQYASAADAFFARMGN